MSRACEAWLKSEDSTKVAEAMISCQNASGNCFYDGRCHYGDCFKPIREKITKGEIENRFSVLENKITRLEQRLSHLLKSA